MRCHHSVDEYCLLAENDIIVTISVDGTGQRLRMNSCVFVVNFIFLLALLNVQKVYGSGVVQLRIEEFQNNGGRDAQGRCCQDNSQFNHGSTCGLQCRTAFNVCFTHYKSRVGCTFGSRRSATLGGNAFEFNLRDYADNILMADFNFTWPGSLSLLITAYDQIEGKIAGPSIASMTKDISPLRPGSTWKTETQSQQGRLMRFSYRVRCKQFYYGSGCSNYCKPRNDRFGHWTCNNDGKKVCLDGWKSKSSRNYCLEPICRPGCSTAHGFCKQPNECQCRYGWQGNLCEKCVPEPRCRHGTCQSPFQCICKQGWGGMFCNLDLNFCVHHKPCKNGARCRNAGLGTFACECQPGFTGERCEYSTNICDASPCQNGGQCKATSSGYTCQCSPGYSGSLCEDHECLNNPCKNGGSCVPEGATGYRCECRPGFVGQQCERRRSLCSEVVCFNGGTCKSSVNGAECVCPSGFTGSSCRQTSPVCSKECKHGRCLKRDGIAACKCQNGYYGDACELEDTCGDNPCMNEGICQREGAGEYSCFCMDGYTGTQCEKREDSNASAQNTKIIIYPKDGDGIGKTQSITVGLLSVLIVVLIIGLVVCLTYPAKKRNGYIRGIFKKRNKSESVSVATNDNRHDNFLALEVEATQPEVDQPCVDIDTAPAKVVYRHVMSRDDTIRVSFPPCSASRNHHGVRCDTSLPSYQEACGGGKFKPQLV